MSVLGAGSESQAGSFRAIRRGLALTPEVWDGIWFTVILAIVAASGRVMVAIGIQLALDHATGAGAAGAGATVTTSASAQAMPYIAACGLGVIVAGAASVWANRRLIRASESALATLRTSAFSRILRLPAQALGDAPRSAHVARVTSDIDTITQFTQSGGLGLITNLFQAIVAAAVMIWYSWLLGLIVLIVAIPFVVVLRGVQRVIAARFHRVRSAVGHVYGAVGEALEGVEVIRGFGAQDRVLERLDDRIDDVATAQRATLVPVGANISTGELVNGIITTAVILVGVALGTAQLSVGWLPRPTVGEVVAFLFLITFFVRPLQFMVGQLAQAQSAAAGWQRVLDVFDLGDPDAAERPHALAHGPVAVDIVDLSFAYAPGVPVLRDISARIAPGANVAIVGETGSGKTTLAKLLTRQLETGTGAILVGGVPIERITEDSFARRIAVVPQDAFVFDRTVAENISLVDDRVDERRVHGVLHDLGLDDWVAQLPLGIHTPVGQRGTLLSAGGRQIVALARAAYLDPDLLVLDEATSGIDPETDVRIHRALHRLTAGRTTITIAHRMATARRADLILVLDRGALVESGAHDDLIRAGGRYAALYEAWLHQPSER